MTKGTQRVVAILVCAVLFCIWVTFTVNVAEGFIVDFIFCSIIFGIGKLIWNFSLDEELEDSGKSLPETEDKKETDEE